MFIKRRDNVPALWRDLPGLTPWDGAVRAMGTSVAAVLAGGREEVWVSQSPEGYSRGAEARAEHAPRLGPAQPPVEGSGARTHPGSWWYHGPGVVTALAVLDLRARRKSVTVVSEAFHQWALGAVRLLGAADARVRDDCPGVWVGDLKVAAVALDVRGWVTSYGVSVVNDPDMSRFAGFKACGERGGSVGSLAGVGLVRARAEVCAALRESFHEVLGRTSDAAGELPREAA